MGEHRTITDPAVRAAKRERYQELKGLEANEVGEQLKIRRRRVQRALQRVALAALATGTQAR